MKGNQFLDDLLNPPTACIGSGVPATGAVLCVCGRSFRPVHPSWYSLTIPFHTTDGRDVDPLETRVFIPPIDGDLGFWKKDTANEAEGV